MSQARGPSIQCPTCGNDGSEVVDSRPSSGTIRRRRQCDECHTRFTTFEGTGDAGLPIQLLHTLESGIEQLQNDLNVLRSALTRLRGAAETKQAPESESP